MLWFVHTKRRVFYNLAEVMQMQISSVAQQKKKKLWRRGSQMRIGSSDQIPKELIPSRLCVPRQLWVFYWRFWRLDHLFPNASDSSVCLLLSRMHTCPREGSQTCNKGRIADLKIAVYTCRLTFSQSGRRWIQWLHQMSPRGCCEHKAD